MYERVSDDGTKCHKPFCKAREVITELGECELCDDYKDVINSDIMCEEPQC